MACHPEGTHIRAKLGLIATIIMIAVLATAISVYASWPTQSQWIPTVGADWSYIYDPLSDVTPSGYLDLVTDLTAAQVAASYWYYDGTDLHFRMILDGDPVKNRGLVTAEMLPFGWNILLESTGDMYPDWSLSVDGTGSADVIHTMYNLGLDVTMDGETGNTVTASQAPYVGADGYQYLINGYVRSKQVTTDPTKWHNGNPDYYLEFAVPLTWFSRVGYTTPAPVTGTTPVKFAFGTGASGQTINKDLAGQSNTTLISDFLNGIPSVGLDSGGTYGVLLDTRHASSPPAMGIWYRGETVTVGGYGWPTSGPYYTGHLKVRILNPSGGIAWEGTVPSSTLGAVTNAPTIPLGAVAPIGVYQILVADPRNLSSYLFKDSFTVAAPVLDTSTKQVDKLTAGMLEVLTYTITVRNTGNLASANTVVTDYLPSGVTYIAGSTTLNGSPVADSAGGSPLFTGYSLGSVPAGTTHVFAFRVSVNQMSPDQTVLVNAATITWTGGSVTRSATTTVIAPRAAVNKGVDLAAALPGQTLTYTMTIANDGHMGATSLKLFDYIPANTEYVIGSATRGGDIVLSFLHELGGAYDSLEAHPVVGLRWSIPSLPAGGSRTITFQVTVK